MSKDRIQTLRRFSDNGDIGVMVTEFDIAKLTESNALHLEGSNSGAYSRLIRGAAITNGATIESVESSLDQDHVVMVRKGDIPTFSDDLAREQGLK